MHFIPKDILEQKDQVKNSLIKIGQKIAARFKITEDITNYLVSVSKVGQPTQVAVPTELIPLGFRILFRGMLNNLALNPNLDWVLPYWVEKQYNPISPSFMGRGHQLFIINSTHRNWTGVGVIGSKEEAVVDERGGLMPHYDGYTWDFWVYRKGKFFAPSQQENILQKLEDNLPIVTTYFTADDLEVSSSIFASKVGELDLAFEEIKIKNKSPAVQNLSLIFALRPYNTEGLSLVKNISYKDNVFIIDGKLGPILLSPQAEVFLGNESIGDVSLKYSTDYNLSFEKKDITCKIGLCSAAAEYTLELEPQKEKIISTSLPIQKIKFSQNIVEKIKAINIAQQKEEVKNFWKINLKDKVKISLPEKKLQDSFEANLSYLLMLWDGEEITPGVFTYHHFWFRDAAYQISALDKMGMSSEARKILLTYPARQKNDGFFYSQNGEWDSNGQAIWTLYEHYKYTRDKEYLNTVYPSMKKGVFWIEEKRKETKKQPSPHFGLLPAGLSAEHLGPNDYFYWDDFWALGGIQSAIYATEELGKEEDKVKFQNIYNELFRDVEKSCKWVQDKLNLKAIPSSPYRRPDASLIGSVVALYPLQIFSPFEETLIATQKAISDYASLEGIFFQDMAHSGYGTYLNMQYAETYLMQRDKHCWYIIDWLLEHSTSTYTWPEAINPRTGGGVIGDGHHGWAVADWCHLLRNVLFFEEGECLILTPALKDDWIKEGNVIEIQNAPSYFGKISFKLQIKQNSATLIFNSSFVREPDEIEFNFPKEIKSAKIKEKEIPYEKNKIILHSADKLQLEIGF